MFNTLYMYKNYTDLVYKSSNDLKSGDIAIVGSNEYISYLYDATHFSGAYTREMFVFYKDGGGGSPVLPQVQCQSITQNNRFDWNYLKPNDVVSGLTGWYKLCGGFPKDCVFFYSKYVYDITLHDYVLGTPVVKFGGTESFRSEFDSGGYTTGFAGLKAPLRQEYYDSVAYPVINDFKVENYWEDSETLSAMMLSPTHFIKLSGYKLEETSRSAIPFTNIDMTSTRIAYAYGSHPFCSYAYVAFNFGCLTSINIYNGTVAPLADMPDALTSGGIAACSNGDPSGWYFLVAMGCVNGVPTNKLYFYYPSTDTWSAITFEDYGIGHLNGAMVVSSPIFELNYYGTSSVAFTLIKNGQYIDYIMYMDANGSITSSYTRYYTMPYPCNNDLLAKYKHGEVKSLCMDINSLLYLTSIDTIDVTAGNVTTVFHSMLLGIKIQKIVSACRTYDYFGKPGVMLFVLTDEDVPRYMFAYFTCNTDVYDIKSIDYGKPILVPLIAA